MNKFNPQPDASTYYKLQFPFGDFQQRRSQQFNSVEYMTKVAVNGQDPVPWYANDKLYQFLIHVAKAENDYVQINRDGSEPHGIRKGATWTVLKTIDGQSHIWHIWANGDRNRYHKSSDFTPQSQPTSNPAPPGPPMNDDTPPPPDNPNPPTIDGQQRDRAVADGISPAGSAPPRILRSANECIAVMDLCVTNAIRIAKKNKPHVGHVDDIACKMYESMMISGVRIDDERAKVVVEQLKKVEE